MFFFFFSFQFFLLVCNSFTFSNYLYFQASTTAITVSGITAWSNARCFPSSDKIGSFQPVSERKHRFVVVSYSYFTFDDRDVPATDLHPFVVWNDLKVTLDERSSVAKFRSPIKRTKLSS